MYVLHRFQFARYARTPRSSFWLCSLVNYQPSCRILINIVLRARTLWLRFRKHKPRTQHTNTDARMLNIIQHALNGSRGVRAAQTIQNGTTVITSLHAYPLYVTHSPNDGRVEMWRQLQIDATWRSAVHHVTADTVDGVALAETLERLAVGQRRALRLGRV